MLQIPKRWVFWFSIDIYDLEVVKASYDYREHKVYISEKFSSTHVKTHILKTHIRLEHG